VVLFISELHFSLITALSSVSHQVHLAAGQEQAERRADCCGGAAGRGNRARVPEQSEVHQHGGPRGLPPGARGELRRQPNRQLLQQAEGHTADACGPAAGSGSAAEDGDAAAATVLERVQGKANAGSS